MSVPIRMTLGRACTPPIHLPRMRILPIILLAVPIPGSVVPSGPYAGHLLVGQHRYFLAGGSYDWFWLLTPEGTEVGPVAETEEALKAFREMYGSP